jgi:hypothetical protein
VTVVDLTPRLSRAPAPLSQAVLNLDESSTPADVIDVLILDAFSAGTQPYAYSADVPRLRKEAPLHPAGARLLRAAVDPESRQVHLYGGEGWTLRVTRWRNGGADLTVTAVTEELARLVLDEAARDASLPAPPPDESVPVGFWHASKNGYQRRKRPITTAPWESIRSNYAGDAAAALDRLMALTADDVRGRLLLLYGPPGTGKTTALRTLAWQWRSWCRLDCVLDPERLFADSGYLTEVAVGEEGESGKRCWRLLLLEDCDELIGGGAKHASGQALSRLLNLTDGLLGQGRDVLVAITTNEDVSRLHPAVIRPGRCLARLELGPLPYEQACAWLGRSAGVPAGGATLAQLYALRDGAEPVAAGTLEAPPHTGLYL